MECVWKSCRSRRSPRAHSACQGWDVLWADQQRCGTGRAAETLALDWTSAARAMEAVERTSRSPGTSQSCAAGTGLSAGGRTPKTALRAFPACPSSIADVLYTPASRPHGDCTHPHEQMAYFYTSLPAEVPLCEQDPEPGKDWSIVTGAQYLTPHKPNKTSDKKLDRPTYGNICNSRDLEAQNKMPSTITQESHTPPGAVALLKPLLFWRSRF